MVKLKINGKSTMVTLQEDLDLLIAKLGMDNLDKSKLPDLKAPMPGLITARDFLFCNRHNLRDGPL